MSSAPVKLASHDLQLATLISMGFEASAAEQALERNNWKVSESIDYLLAAGIGMNDNNSVAHPVMHSDEDDEKSVERQRLDRAAATMIPTIASNVTPLPTLVEDRSRGHGTQEELVDGWIDEPSNMNTAPTTRGRSVRRGDASLGSTTDLTPPRRTGNVGASRSRQGRGRGYTTGQRHAHFQDDPLEQPRYSRNNNHQTRQTTAQDTNEYREPPRYNIPPEPRHFPITYDERDFKHPDDASLEVRLEDGFSPSSGVSTMATGGRKKKKRHGADPVDHGVHLGTIQESFPGRDGIGGSRRQVGEDDISMVAMAGGSRKQSAVSSLTGMPSVPETQREDATVSRKDIRRLYMLVCAAILLVVVGIVVAVSLVLTRPVDASNNAVPTDASTLPPPKPTTSEPLPMPSIAPGDEATSPAPFDDSNATGNSTQAPAEAPNETEPTKSSNVLEPSPAPSERSPFLEQFRTPSPSLPGENRRAEQEQEDESHHHLRSRELYDGQ